MSQAEKASEPSMEEILASIRKIIAEEPIGSRPLNGAGRADPPPPMRPELPAPAAKAPMPPPGKPSSGQAPRAASPSAARVDDMLDMIDDGLADRGTPARGGATNGGDAVPSWLFPKPQAADTAPATDPARSIPELKVPVDNRPYFQQTPPSPAQAPTPSYANGTPAPKPSSIRRDAGGPDLGTFVPSRQEQTPSTASMPLSRDPIASAPDRRTPTSSEANLPHMAEQGMLGRAPQRADERANATAGQAASPAMPLNGSPAVMTSRSAPQAEPSQSPIKPAPSVVLQPQAANPAPPQAKSPAPDAPQIKQQPAPTVATTAAPTVTVAAQPSPAIPQATAPKPIEDVANPTVRVNQPIDMPTAVAPKVTPSVTASGTVQKPPVVHATVAPSAPPVVKPVAAAASPSTAVGSSVPAPQPGAQEVLGPVRTMEDTVAELLRPMLRQWLDQNMPRIVEKALRVELAESAKKRLPGG